MSNANIEAEEKMESELQRTPTTTPLSPSKQRAKVAVSAGLSELSKQLRILQATNEAQSVENNRLERQLRILTELQGIGVADLRKALEEACANEAFGELQHRVAKLRAELEAATLAKYKEHSMQTSAPLIANLELRIGELEEIEERHRAEIHLLYDQLGQERARATRLGAENDQHKRDIDRLNAEIGSANQVESSFQAELSRHPSGERTKLEKISETVSADGSIHEPVVDVEPTHQELFSKLTTGETINAGTAEKNLKRDNYQLSKEIQEKERELRDAYTKHEIETDKKNLVIKQLQDADSENLLRIAQFKARFQVQDERIDDMEQQLRSLYAAFGLIQEEQDAADRKCTALKINLNDADGELARCMQNVQRGTNNDQDKNHSQHSEERTELLGSHAPAVRDGIPRMIEASVINASRPRPSGGIPREYAQTSRSLPVPTQTATAHLLDNRPPRSPGTWELLFPEARKTRTHTEGIGTELVMQGFLLIKSRSVVRKWKSRFCKLYKLGTHYQWDVEGKSFTLGIGISKVEFNPNHPLSFTVLCNPYDNEAPIIHAAASTEEIYHRWFDALLIVTNLDRCGRRRSAEFAIISPPSHAVEEQEEADLEEALRLSRSIA